MCCVKCVVLSVLCCVKCVVLCVVLAGDGDGDVYY